MCVCGGGVRRVRPAYLHRMEALVPVILIEGDTEAQGPNGLSCSLSNSFLGLICLTVLPLPTSGSAWVLEGQGIVGMKP